MEQWRRNNIAATLSVFFLTAGFSFTIPFLPLYLEDLDGLSGEQAALWAGIATGLGGVGAFFSGPIWGMFGDRFGRKPMLVRAAAGGAVGLLAIGLATATWQVVIARFWVGVMGGSPAASMALVTSRTPEEHVPRWLANLQASSLLGIALGPVAAAGLIEWLDFRGTFFVTSGVMALGALATVVIVKEDRSSFRGRAPNPTPKHERVGLRHILRSKPARTTFFLVAAMGIGVAMIQPVLAGFVKTLVSTGNVNFGVGALYFGISALGALASLLAGRLLPSVGVVRVAVFSSIGVGVFLLPQGLSTAYWHLVPLVLMMAFFYGAVQASIVRLVAAVIPKDQVGTGFGVYQSIRAASLQIAPAFGGAIAASVGFAAVFPIAGLVVLVAGVVASRLLPKVLLAAEA